MTTVSRPSYMARSLLPRLARAQHQTDRGFRFVGRLRKRLERAAPLAIERQAPQPAEQLAPLAQRLVHAAPALVQQMLRELLRAAEHGVRHAAPACLGVRGHRRAGTLHDRETGTAARRIAYWQRHNDCATCARPCAGSCSQAERISFSNRLTSSSHSGLLEALACMRRVHMYS